MGILAFILLGPEGFKKTSKEIGRRIYTFMRSPAWVNLQKEFFKWREMPRTIVREAGLEDAVREIRQESDKISRDFSSKPYMSPETIWNPNQKDFPQTQPPNETELPGDKEAPGQSVEDQFSKPE